MTKPPTFHISFPPSKAVEVLRIHVATLERENKKLRAERDWLREFARSQVKGVGARLEIMNRSDAVLRELMEGEG